MQMFDGDVVLILGGGSGLGLGIARHCVSEGARVAIFEISEAKIVALKGEFGDDVLLFRGDVTSPEDLLACRQAIVERWGRLDSLIGSQGIFDGQVPLRDVAIERVPSLFDELFHVNVLGYILACKVFLELLEESNGSIVLTASVAAYAADGGGLMYTATKGAVVSAVRQLAFEFSPRVRVNGVAPGAIADSQLQGPRSLGLEGFKQSDIPKDAMLNTFRKLTLMSELPTPLDYAPIYAYLASRYNAVVTGQTVLLEQGALNRAALSGPGATGGIGV
ncbi:3-phenylpropionate-dihydrodiol/cinnamic acid-dihydrodiol dehydrogenase [Acrocarpospora macrocephala]|uniref:3-phenylpropionate-dihydrodiol/cinnamic acid-dihydrodiol dehydrogenase n=1 Tax=Acrocarpospora macrocephala TaxID=150177 RepID=A0A5M3WKT3_9ACTN|nr:SDR family oxidoreductase [Acrocarpospora macrocephala]GES09070.1 3-phenylpropionate-dihydrodiol/cinnamic acid-dihydrodiol dehydrogenase [Acrocarpospora macrocephala]